jgi:hypothetical protein
VGWLIKQTSSRIKHVDSLVKQISLPFQAEEVLIEEMPDRLIDESDMAIVLHQGQKIVAHRSITCSLKPYAMSLLDPTKICWSLWGKCLHRRYPHSGLGIG